MRGKATKLHDLREDHWLKDFRRSLAYVWPHKKFLIWSVVFSFLGAASYSVGLGMILPVLKVMVEEEGLHGWAYRLVAENRTGLRYDTYDSRRVQVVPDAAEFSLLIREIEPESPFAGLGLRSGDVVIGLDGVTGSASELLDRLAHAPANEAVALDLLAQAQDGKTPGAVAAMLPAGPVKWQLLRAAADWVPAETEPGDRLRTLLVILGFLFGVSLLGNAFRFGTDYLTALLSHRAVLDLRRRMSRQVMALPIGHYSRNVSDTIARFLQDTQELHKGYVTLFQKMVREPLKAAGVLCMAILLDWRLTVVMVVAAPLAAVLIRRFGKKVRKANLRVLQGYSVMLSALEGALSGMRAVKGYGTEDYERKRLFHIDRQMFREHLRMERVDALSKPVMEMIGFVVVAAGIMWLAQRVVGGTLKPAAFATTVIMLAAMIDPVRKLSNTYVRLQRANAAAHRIFGLVDTASEERNPPLARALQPLTHVIEFREVTFTYEGTDAPALSEINLSVNKGEVVALVGPNGSGKTTLVSLLLRFFEPQAGGILIDGQDIARCTIRSLRKQISLISQETVIFGDTVRANIAYGKRHATEEQIVAAAKKAYAHEFITQLPNGYDTLIGEHGATLSGGQRQRLSIARAILRDAPILVFDEATSQIDSESELKIHQALEAFLKDRTGFVIAHRFSTINTADRIVVFDAGRIIAAGTHDVLLESCELYARLCETQLRTDRPEREARKDDKPAFEKKVLT